MENELPEGWEWVKIGECFEQVKDKIEPTENTSLTYIGLEHLVKGGGIDIAGNSDSLKSTKSVFQRGDVLYGKLRPYLNKHSFVNFDGVCSTDILVFRAENLSAAKYLNYYLGTNEVISYANENSQGINLPRVSGKVMADLTIPLPPLAEQTRIVAKLDAAFGHLETLKTSLARIPELLKKFRRTVLTQAVTGKLTESWREENIEVEKDNLPTSWITTSLKNIGQISGGITLNAKRQELPLKVDYLRVANVYANELRLHEIKKVGVTQSEYNKTLLDKDDLLIVEGNGSIDQIGRVAIWSGVIAPCLHQNHLIRVRIGKNSDAKYVLYYLLSPQGREMIKTESSSTTGLHTLNISKIGNMKFSLPPLEEQHEIVTRVEALFAKADALEAQYLSLKARIDALPQALLAKAFRGELVPQNPADEPASVLLARLQSAPAPGGKPKTGQTRLAFMGE